MPRLKRWAKRIVIGLLALLVALTLASVGYNAATDGEIKPATALYPGPFARVDGRLVAYRTWGHSGTPIVLVGGFVVPSFVWKRVGPLLGRTHRVFALDLPPWRQRLSAAHAAGSRGCAEWEGNRWAACICSFD